MENPIDKLEEKCPCCRDGILVKGTGVLDQCGQTYLPATTWTCSCGFKSYIPASKEWSTYESHSR